MKFPSLQQLSEDAIRSAKRFPLSLVTAFLASTLLIYLIEIDRFDQEIQLVNLLLVLMLGIPLFFCVDIYGEKHQFSPIKRKISWIVVVILLGLVYFSFPSENTFTNTRIPYIRYLVYNLTAHLLVAFLSYWDEKSDDSFWKFNENIFIRVVTGVFYSLVIHTGISLAMGAVSLLFSIEIDPKNYFYIFILSIGIFNTWFFLAGAPKDLNEGVSLINYPKGLKIFTQFILIPLLLVYMTILYIYGGKIIFTWDWPKGIVSYMIIAISVLGIFTNLLLFPIQDQKESSWIRTFYKAFYFLIIPLIIILFLAIGIRVKEYGLTVNRYIVLLMGVWLTFIAGYFIIGPGKIKTIPISLAIFMILGSFGPWGMFSLSESNQIKRLEHILTESEILQNGKIQNEVFWEISEKGALKPTVQKNTNRITPQDQNEVNSIIQYLETYHGLNSILPWFEQDLATLFQEADDPEKRNISLNYSKFIVESMGLSYVNELQIQLNDKLPIHFRWEIQFQEVRPISGYDYELAFDLNLETNLDKTWPVPEIGIAKIWVDEDLSTFHVEIGNVKGHVDLIEMKKEIENLYGQGYVQNISPADMSFEIPNDSMKIQIVFQSVSKNSETEKEVDQLHGIILLGKK
ncbi:DUF4153 domain-containing protein [Algoriphagus halophilus]|uniref:DUF4153 domain-containing protein n=1 Tax=Algoriphagus halophilus TaxID=226505 RepID=A0A1N6H8L7_9BACT|nr:DUF4153 domain-containing protein [Algoriphagus halophilus]SIO16112.1 protein of unknown function [Algoriphagus halophilus]